MKTIIFHSPLPVYREPLSGSAVRPQKMLEAFKTLGVEVFVIDGDSRSRKELWEEAKKSSGCFLGIYSELSTMPIALTDSDHLPRHAFLDMSNFLYFRRKGVPVAAFYRDLHWKFPQYKKSTHRFKRIIATLFYKLELVQLKKSVSHLFLPSLKMLDFLGDGFCRDKSSRLPPGGSISEVVAKPAGSGKLRLLYVGGITPPLYDIADMLDAVTNVNGVFLNICCREKEYVDNNYLFKNLNNINIFHKHGESLKETYERNDVFIMFLPDYDYLKFAMPVKFFEAVGHGLPIIANANTELGELVVSQNLGWVVSDKKELELLLLQLSATPALLCEKLESIRRHQHHHTWVARARQVLNTFEEIRLNGQV